MAFSLVHDTFSALRRLKIRVAFNGMLKLARKSASDGCVREIDGSITNVQGHTAAVVCNRALGSPKSVDTNASAGIAVSNANSPVHTRQDGFAALRRYVRRPGSGGGVLTLTRKNDEEYGKHNGEGNDDGDGNGGKEDKRPSRESTASATAFF
jgi:hypothetical protein